MPTDKPVVILSEEVVAEIASRKTYQYRTMVTLSVAERDALCATVKQLRAERDATMKVLEPSMPESGLEDAARQLKQAYISERDNAEVADARLKEVEAERDKLKASRRVYELDNHHNALACGYCVGPLKDELERLKKLELDHQGE